MAHAIYSNFHDFNSQDVKRERGDTAYLTAENEYIVWDGNDWVKIESFGEASDANQNHVGVKINIRETE